MSVAVLECEPLPPVDRMLAQQVLGAVVESGGAGIADEAAAYLAQQATPNALSFQTIAEASPEIARAAQEAVAAMMAGPVAVQEAVRTDAGGRCYRTAYDMLMAPEGDKVAEMGGVTSVVTMLQESLSPHTNIIEVEVYVDDEGTVWQYAQNDQSIAQNTLAIDHSVTAQAESANLLAVGPLVRDGHLRHDGPPLWEFSVIPEGDRAALRQKGYFMHTMSFIARRISVGPDGRTLTIRSHFMAGADFVRIAQELGPVETEQDVIAREAAAQSTRHDKSVLGRFFREALKVHGGVQATSDGFLRQAGFIDEAAFEGGEAGVIATLDAITAQEIGADVVFYGVRGVTADHTEFLERRRHAQHDLIETAKSLWAQARAEVRKPGVCPQDVPGILKELSKAVIADKVLAGQADIMVLGSRAAVTALATIEAFHAGDITRAEELRNQTIELTQPGGCPPAEDRSSATCEFMSKECPKCGKKNVWTTISRLISGKKRISGSCGCGVTSA